MANSTFTVAGTVTGSGTVQSGTQNDLAYYANNGTVVSGLATGNNGVLITSGGGVPSISSTLPSAVQGNITSTGALASGSLTTGFTAVTVPLGGTGVTTLTTAYGVLCAGTTATGNVQTLSALGAANTVLTSNGAGALPSFQAASVPTSAAKAWWNWDGVGDSLVKNFNVTSVTDNGTGDYTINFTSNIADANYGVVLGGGELNVDSVIYVSVKCASSGGAASLKSTSQLELAVGRTATATLTDSQTVYGAVYD